MKKWNEKYPLKYFLVRYSLPVLTVVSTFFLLLGIVLFFIIIFREEYFSTSGKLDVILASNFGTFFQGLIGTIFSVSGALFVAVSLLYQALLTQKAKIEEIFFRMLDYHRENVSNIRIKSYKDYGKQNVEKIEGPRAFVIFKLQIFDLVKLIQDYYRSKETKLTEDEEINLAYMIFYYGIDKDWDSFTNIHLKSYGKDVLDYLEHKRQEILNKTKKNIGRTNQTVLSSYYRNMYNAVKFIDENIFLSKDDKYKYVKMYRSQLSNSELAVLFFNLKSKFGANWKFYKKNGKLIEHNLVERYQLIKNIPEGYLHNYNHKNSFDMEYEDDELQN